MSAKLKKYSSHLKVLARSKPRVCKLMVKEADAGLFNCLCECAYNILKGNVRVNASQLKSLSRYKKELRALVNCRKKLLYKRKVLQKGGFIGALLKPLAGIAAPLVAKGVGKVLGIL